MKKGFTLAEMLMTVGVIGVLGIILLPLLKDSMPNQELLMFRKAFSITEKVVSELVNDEELYPELEGEMHGHYLANLQLVRYNGNDYGSSDPTSDAAAEKFANLFMARLNMLEPAAGSSAGRFTTSDGIQWYLPITNFQSNNARVILIDVDGANKGPNCHYNSAGECGGKPDWFKIKVYNDGRVVPGGCMEKEYLQRKSTSRHAALSIIDESNLASCLVNDDVESTEWNFGAYSNP